MEHYYFSDLTFMIPVRVDSTVRIENLLAVLKYIRPLKAKVLIYEAAAYNNHFLERLLPKDKNITYRFFADRDVVFYRTHYLNLMTREAATPYVAIWDADVVVHPSQIAESMAALREGKAEVSYPYAGDFMDVDPVLREQYLLSPNIKLLQKYKSAMRYLYGTPFVGGGIIVNREKYMEAGMENENFYGWGPEDLERIRRWENADYTIHRSAGTMFHLYHSRDNNGRIRSVHHGQMCLLHVSKTTNSSRTEIVERAQAGGICSLQP